MIDTYEKGITTGWALDRRRPADPINVQLYVDGERVLESTANLPRPDLAKISPISTDKGFEFAIPPHILECTFPRLELYFENTNDPVPVSDAAARFINRPIINLRELEVCAGYSPWSPSPPSQIITHITGQIARQDEQRRSYLRSGMIGAADVYNLSLDLGLDPRQPNFRVIDIGCGSGRYAPFLKQYMPGCRYLGLDVWPEAIAWAQKVITAVQPDLRFILLDNASGYVASNAYRLPVETRSAQLVMAMSLFTHLTPNACLAYFHETRRALSENGAALFTFMILDENSESHAETAAKRAGLPMTKTQEACWFGKEGYLDIYYTEAAIRRMAEEASLVVIAVRRGHWCRRDGESVNSAAYQDMIILRPSHDAKEKHGRPASHTLLQFGRAE